MNASIAWNQDFSGTALLSVTGVNECGEGNYSEDLVIDVDDIPEPAVEGDTQVCDNQSNNYSSVTTDGNTYTWTVEGGTITGGQGTSEITVLWGEPGTGSIYLEEETPNGCYAQSETIEVTIDNCTGLYENENATAFSFYPNPAHDQLTIQLKNNTALNGNLKVMNQLGQTVMEIPVVSQNGSLDLNVDISSLQKGIYLINLVDAKEHSTMKKFVKE